MKKRPSIPFVAAILAVTTLFSFLLILAPIQAAPVDSKAANSPGEAEYFAAFLSGDEEVPSVNTDASGVARLTLDGTTLAYEVAVRDITDISASHIHIGVAGANGPVVFPLYTGTGDFDPDNPISGMLMLTEEQANDLRSGAYYVNVHTTGYPAGEIRGQIGAAATTAYQTALSGANEVRFVESGATGQAFMTLSADMTQLYYRILVADITDITASHIHEAPPGSNGGVVFPLYDGVERSSGPNSGSGSSFDPQNPVSGVLSPTISQVAAMLAGDYYVNVHTAEHPAGEIRGQIVPFAPRTDTHALLTGDEEVPPVATEAVGVARFQLSDDLSELDYYVAADNITGITASHLHTAQPGQNGGVAHTLFDGSFIFEPGMPVSDVLIIDAQSVLDLISGNYYVNVHTVDNPSGEIRGQVIAASSFAAALSSDQEVPPVSTDASGKAQLAVNDDASKLYYRVQVDDINGITVSHLHKAPAGENGPVVFPLFTGSGVFDPDNPISGMLDLTDEHIFDLLSGEYYINVHTADYPSGEIRSQLAPDEPRTHLYAKLSGDQEVPPVTTNASGQGNFTLDSVRGTLHYYVSVNDISDVNASHIHLGPAGKNGPVVFPLFTGSGIFDPDYPVGSGVMLNAENLVDLLTGFYYVNVHTTKNPSGEIRGQIGQQIRPVYLPIMLNN